MEKKKMNFRSKSKKKKLKQIKPKNVIVDLRNIKSLFILKKIFNLLRKSKTLNIMKYSKKLQRKFGFNFNYYKEYFLFLSPIEIELKLVYNEYGGKFINISDKNKKYYHIYFDNSLKEIKRNYLNENEKVEKITIIIDYQITSFKNLFETCYIIKSVFFKRFNRINITDMSGMFKSCTSLKELNFSKFINSNVTNMEEMFFCCLSLKELNLSKLIIDNVTDMSLMFFGCLSLEKLDLSNFNGNNVIDLNEMLSGCSNLKQFIYYSDNDINTDKIFNLYKRLKDSINRYKATFGS